MKIEMHFLKLCRYNFTWQSSATRIDVGIYPKSVVVGLPPLALELLKGLHLMRYRAILAECTDLVSATYLPCISHFGSLTNIQKAFLTQ